MWIILFIKWGYFATFNLIRKIPNTGLLYELLKQVLLQKFVLSILFISCRHYSCFYDNSFRTVIHGPLTRYVKLRVARAPGMPGTFSPQLRVSDPDMHHGTCVTHVSWCMPGSLSSGFLSSRWWGKRSRHSRRMRNPQFYVSGKRPMKRLKGSMINTFPGTK